MSRALDKLDAVVTASVKDGTATKNMTREQLLDYSISCSSALKAHLQFFTEVDGPRLHDSLQQLRKQSPKGKNKFVDVYEKLLSNLTGIAKARQESKFCGAIVEAMQAMVGILDEVAINVDKMFVDKTFNLYNTKISHIAIYGILDNTSTMAAFVESFIAAYFASRDPKNFKLPPYQAKYLDEHAEAVGDICCRMINGKMGKTFAAGIVRFKSSGNDTAVLTSDNQSAAKFAKLGGEVSESDVSSGCKGLYIFKVIGDFFVDLLDNRARKMRAMREQHKARVEMLQMDLEGEDPNSDRYKKIVKIIKNYNDMIDRLNQKIDAYYNEED